MNNFFVVEPQSPKAVLVMFDLLKYYRIQHYTMPVKDKQPVLVVSECVYDEDSLCDGFTPNDLMLAEMAFQMNYPQVGNLCPVCKAEGEEDNCCGHLTFVVE